MPRQLLVLNVDDTPANLYVSSKLLRSAGYKVVEATDGTQALTLARELLPDAIVLDVRLPDINGWDITRELRADARTAAIPVMQVSACYTSATDIFAGFASGATRYLPGELNVEMFVAGVRQLFNAKLGPAGT
jgi:CheY-like chemotaxis protein